MRMMRVPAAFLEWLSFRRSVVLAVVVLGGYVAFVMRLRHLYGASDPERVVSLAVTMAPIAGLLLAPALIGIVFGYAGWVHERVWTPWQGTYHAFDDHQIRVVEARDRLWFSSKDVHAALAMPRREAVMRAMKTAERRDDPDAGELLSNDGLRHLLGRSTDRSALRLLAWADRDVRRIWQKKRDMQSLDDGQPRA